MSNPTESVSTEDSVNFTSDQDETQHVPSQPPANNRSILILREIEPNSPENAVRDLFDSENCPCKPVHCEYALHNSWYVTFNSDEDAKLALAYIRKNTATWNGQPIMARYKSRGPGQMPAASRPQTYQPSNPAIQHLGPPPTIIPNPPQLPPLPHPHPHHQQHNHQQHPLIAGPQHYGYSPVTYYGPTSTHWNYANDLSKVFIFNGLTPYPFNSRSGNLNIVTKGISSASLVGGEGELQHQIQQRQHHQHHQRTNNHRHHHHQANRSLF